MFRLNSIISLDPKVKEVILQLNQRKFTVKDTHLTYRAFNHYKQASLLLKEPDNSKGWVRLSGIDLVWLEIVRSLRSFGVALDKVRCIKENLFAKGFEGTIDRTHVINIQFEEEIALSITNRYNLYLIILSDFSCALTDSQSKRSSHLKPYGEDSFISVPLSPITLSVFHRLK